MLMDFDDVDRYNRMFNMGEVRSAISSTIANEELNKCKLDHKKKENDSSSVPKTKKIKFKKSR